MSATASVISSTASMERRSGRTSTRSTAMPKTATNKTASTEESHSGRWASAVKVYTP